MKNKHQINPKINPIIIAVIPAHNEEKHIEQVINQTKQHVNHVIVVDDASTDNTAKIAEKENAVTIKHIINLGLGGTLKTGCDAALLLGADIIVTLDGDGQHDPKEIPELIKPILKKEAEAVFGQRAFDEKMPFAKKLGNRFFHRFSRHFFRIKVKDTQTGFRAFTSEAYKKIRWKSRDYAVASEMLINAEKNRVNYAGHTVKTIYHDTHKGTTPIDGLKIAGKMLGLKVNGGK